MKATWIMATNNRPDMLRETLSCCLAQDGQDDWAVNCVVAGSPVDPGIDVCKEFAEAGKPVRYVVCNETRAGCRWQKALEHPSTGEIVMLTGDDDLQPPGRMLSAVSALHRGHFWTVMGEVRYVHYPSGITSIWRGEPLYIGSAMTIAKKHMLEVGFPTKASRGLDGQTSMRLHKKFGKLPFLSTGGYPSVCLQHPTNMWPRRCPGPGEVWHGKGHRYSICGEGDWRDAPMAASQKASLGRLFGENMGGVLASVGDQLKMLKPHFAEPAIEHIERHIKKYGGTALEWGSGDSTIWLAHRMPVYAIEHNPLWAGWAAERARLVRGLVGLEIALRVRHEITEDTKPEYIGIGRHLNEMDYERYVHADIKSLAPFNIAIVDGRARNSCIRRLHQDNLLTEESIVVLDDSQRERYAEGIALMRSCGWAEKVHDGLTRTTTVWTHPSIS